MREVKMKIHTGFSASKNGTDLAMLLLRIATGALMLFYGTFKIINGHGYIREFLAERGLPEFLWLGVPLAEVIVPLLLIMGVLTRISAAIMCLLMVFTLYYWGPGAFTLNAFGGINCDLNLLFLANAVAITCAGSGRFALFKPNHIWLQ